MGIDNKSTAKNGLVFLFSIPLKISPCSSLLFSSFCCFPKKCHMGELKESSSGMINIVTGLLVCIWFIGTALSWGIIIKSNVCWYLACTHHRNINDFNFVLHFECLSKLCPLETGRDLVWFPNLHGKEMLFICGVKGNCWANEILYQTFIQLNKQTRFSL